jgi:hypothetical protein
LSEGGAAEVHGEQSGEKNFGGFHGKYVVWMLEWNQRHTATAVRRASSTAFVRVLVAKCSVIKTGNKFKLNCL